MVVFWCLFPNMKKWLLCICFSHVGWDLVMLPLHQVAQVIGQSGPMDLALKQVKLKVVAIGLGLFARRCCLAVARDSMQP